MNATFGRPQVSDVALHLFRRPIHPEFFETLAFREVRQREYVVRVRITPVGHVIAWQADSIFLTEFIATRLQELPRNGRVWRHRFCGQKRDAFRAAAGISCQTSTQIEILSESIYHRIHEDILADGRRRGLLYLFAPDQFGQLSPISFVTADGRPDCLVVNTFHTYPNECTLIKTQTLIEQV